jgi:GNAT superfamily N-acetyltransferase/RimJ/RimL family protein N-acetyltransferase
MELSWLDPERLDRRDIAGALGVIEAARAVDTPHQMATISTNYSYLLRHGWDGDAPAAAVHRNAAGRVDALLNVWMPRLDNTHVAGIHVVVEPPARRAGLGRRILAAGIQRARDEGRGTLIASTNSGTSGVPFLEATGFTRAAEAVLRRQDPTTVDWSRLDDLYAEAEQRAKAYELVHIAGVTPDDMLGPVATMTAAINDAPTEGLDIEDSVFTPERVRTFEAATVARGRRLYHLIARHRDTGELAGHTVVGVDVERPWHAYQFDTSVVRSHRGNRLGLLLKIGMLKWLATEEPQLRTLDTDNAASNSFMIGINDLIGYQVIGSVYEYQHKLA